MFGTSLRKTDLAATTLLSLLAAAFVGVMVGKPAVVLVPLLVSWLYVRLRGGSLRDAAYLTVITWFSAAGVVVMAYVALFALLIVGCSIASSGCGG